MVRCDDTVSETTASNVFWLRQMRLLLCRWGDTWKRLQKFYRSQLYAPSIRYTVLQSIGWPKCHPLRVFFSALSCTTTAKRRPIFFFCLKSVMNRSIRTNARIVRGVFLFGQFFPIQLGWYISFVTFVIVVFISFCSVINIRIILRMCENCHVESPGQYTRQTGVTIKHVT